MKIHNLLNNVKISGKALVLSSAIFLTLVGSSCQSGQETAVNTANKEATPEKKYDDFQDNLNSVQKAGFTFIYAFRRPDGEVFTSEDKKYLKENSPIETNQWRLVADEKTVIAASHYKFFPKHLDALKKRFSVEDFSTPVDENANQDANSETNTGNVNSNTNSNIKTSNSAK